MLDGGKKVFFLMIRWWLGSGVTKLYPRADKTEQSHFIVDKCVIAFEAHSRTKLRIIGASFTIVCESTPFL